MPEVLRCVSVHSVKGGVGKSSVAYLIARRFAERGEPTLLVDMDLTGTSLADVLRLEAPDSLRRSRTLSKKPTAFLGVSESREALEERAGEPGWGPHAVPVLNDFLLAEGVAAPDVHPLAVSWKSDVDGLLVAPSSALPRDLVAILPVIYDEPNAGFLEGRIEWFLEELLEHAPTIRRVVFDSPPTIPGLSRALLSLAMRLPAKEHLAPDDPLESPPTLFSPDTTIRWAPLLLVSPDHQDLRAADRWLRDKPDDEIAPITVVVNGRDPHVDAEACVLRLRTALVDFEEPDETPMETSYGGRLLERPYTLARVPSFRPWRPGAAKSVEPDGFEALLEHVDALLE